VIKVDECAVEIAVSSPQNPTIAEHGRAIRIDTDRRLIIRERAILVTFAAPSVAAVTVSQRSAGFEPNGLIEVGDRLVEVARAGP